MLRLLIIIYVAFSSVRLSVFVGKTASSLTSFTLHDACRQNDTMRTAHACYICIHSLYGGDLRSAQNTRSHKSVVHFAEMIIIILLRNKFVFIFHAYTTHTHPFCHLPFTSLKSQPTKTHSRTSVHCIQYTESVRVNRKTSTKALDFIKMHYCII